MITPELPRAPIRAPLVMALRTSAEREPIGKRAMFSTTISSVSDMFVPVSPSGTGNTLRRLTSSLRADNVFDAAAIAFMISFLP